MGKVRGDDKAAIMKVIKEETAAFWNKDYKALLKLRVTPATCNTTRDRRPAALPSSRDGARSARPSRSTWKKIRHRTLQQARLSEKSSMSEWKDIAWATYEQHEIASGEPAIGQA